MDLAVALYDVPHTLSSTPHPQRLSTEELYCDNRLGSHEHYAITSIMRNFAAVPRTRVFIGRNYKSMTVRSRRRQPETQSSGDMERNALGYTCGGTGWRRFGMKRYQEHRHNEIDHICKRWQASCEASLVSDDFLSRTSLLL